MQGRVCGGQNWGGKENRPPMEAFLERCQSRTPTPPLTDMGVIQMNYQQSMKQVHLSSINSTPSAEGQALLLNEVNRGIGDFCSPLVVTTIEGILDTKYHEKEISMKSYPEKDISFSADICTLLTDTISIPTLTPRPLQSFNRRGKVLPSKPSLTGTTEQDYKGENDIKLHRGSSFMSPPVRCSRPLAVTVTESDDECDTPFRCTAFPNSTTRNLEYSAHSLDSSCSQVSLSSRIPGTGARLGRKRNLYESTAMSPENSSEPVHSPIIVRAKRIRSSRKLLYETVSKLDKASKPPSEPILFPCRLHMFLTEIGTNRPDIIQWVQNGEAFILHNVDDLGPFLQQYFNHTNYSSLQRQLNMYGWKKHATGCYSGAFFHPYFHRDATKKDFSRIVRFAPTKNTKSTKSTKSKPLNGRTSLKQMRKKKRTKSYTKKKTSIKVGKKTIPIRGLKKAPLKNRLPDDILHSFASPIKVHNYASVQKCSSSLNETLTSESSCRPLDSSLLSNLCTFDWSPFSDLMIDEEDSSNEGIKLIALVPSDAAVNYGCLAATPMTPSGDATIDSFTCVTENNTLSNSTAKKRQRGMTMLSNVEDYAFLLCEESIESAF